MRRKKRTGGGEGRKNSIESKKRCFEGRKGEALEKERERKRKKQNEERSWTSVKTRSLSLSLSLSLRVAVVPKSVVVPTFETVGNCRCTVSLVI